MVVEDVMEVRRLGIRSQVDSHRSISWSQHHYACIVGPLYYTLKVMYNMYNVYLFCVRYAYKPNHYDRCSIPNAHWW